MNILDQINQNPVITVFLILVPVVVGTWRVFHSLYVQPRDFKISSLKDDVTQLRDELVRLRKEPQRPTPQSEDPKNIQKISEAERPLAEAQPEIEEPISQSISSESPLTSLRVCYKMWSDDNQTKLQKQKFEAHLVGKRVSWSVEVESVSEAEDERILLYVADPVDRWDRPRAGAEFPATWQDILLKLRKGDRIILRGTIKEFFLWPSLKDCEVEH